MEFFYVLLQLFMHDWSSISLLFFGFFLEFTPIVKEPTRVSLTIIQIIIHQLSLLIGKFTLKYQ